MNKITEIKLKKTKTSKGQPTVEAHVSTKKGTGTASAPSGTSAGSHEAVFAPKPIEELIKQAQKKAIPSLIGMDVNDQKSIDRTLIEVDGTHNFSGIGGSVAIAVSTACLKSAAIANKTQVYRQLSQCRIKMPRMLGKCIGGGAHAGNSTEIQEFLSIPLTDSFKKAVSLNKKVHALTGKKLKAKKLDLEGGWVAPITNEKALETIADAACEIGRKAKENIAIGIDVAASEIFKGGKYSYKDRRRNAKEQAKYISELIQNYDIYYIEDAFQEDDFESFKLLKKKHRSALICGDDLFATNKERLRKGRHSCNSLIIKPNQIGTITQTQETVELAKKYAYTPVISHRSGETKDPVLADLAVGWGIPFIKIGIVGRERTAKTSRLIKIEGENR